MKLGGVEVAAFYRDGVLSAYPQNFDAQFGTASLHEKYRSVHNGASMTYVDDPILGAARTVLRMDASDTTSLDTGDPANKVRVQLDGQFVFGPGHDVWVGFGVLFPNGFPSLPADGWFLFNELHGPPFNGGSPNELSINTANQLSFSGGKWTAPLVTGAWIDFVTHFRLAPSALHGFAELWMNTGSGWAQQRFKDGSLRRFYKTIDTPNADGWNASQLKHYRKRGMAGWGTVATYFAEHRVGASFAEVAPSSHP